MLSQENVIKIERYECQEIWGIYKYEVLSQSQKIYKQIRDYLKETDVNKAVLRAYILEARSLPEHRGSVINACQHVWGYFKKKATELEKETYLFLLRKYHSGSIPKESLLYFLREMLEKYPNSYLERSTFLGGQGYATLA